MSNPNYLVRLQEKYKTDIRTKLQDQFGYKNPMQVPKLVKVVLNMGVGEAASDQKKLETAVADLALISGQSPVITRSRIAIAGFKIREGLGIGTMVTLRKAKMYEFIDRFVTIVLPRVRDFRGLSTSKGFDGFGNFSMGLKEHTVFPEIAYDKVVSTRGMNIVVVTSAKNDNEAKVLLEALEFPFIKQVV